MDYIEIEKEMVKHITKLHEISKRGRRRLERQKICR